jgi:hypothetical protein
MQNSGAYRSVRTQKVDFVSLADVDISRTRVLDEGLGYQSDRSILYVKRANLFLVIDAIKALRTDYFTFTTLWHGQTILTRGEHMYEIANDSLKGLQLPRDYSLVVRFLETYAKTEGDEPITRSFLPERAVYQTISSQYKAGDTELFVTALVPHKRDTSIDRLPSVQLIPSSAPYHAVAVEVAFEGKKTLLCVRTDLDQEVARENIRPRYLYDLGKVRYGDFETDAHFFVASTQGDSTACTAVNVLKVFYRGREIMTSLPNTHPLQLDGTSVRVGYSKWRRWEGVVRN